MKLFSADVKASKPPGEVGLEVPPSVDWLPLSELLLSSRGFLTAG